VLEDVASDDADVFGTMPKCQRVDMVMSFKSSEELYGLLKALTMVICCWKGNPQRS